MRGQHDVAPRELPGVLADHCQVQGGGVRREEEEWGDVAGGIATNCVGLIEGRFLRVRELGSAEVGRVGNEKGGEAVGESVGWRRGWEGCRKRDQVDFLESVADVGEPMSL